MGFEPNLLAGKRKVVPVPRLPSEEFGPDEIQEMPELKAADTTNADFVMGTLSTEWQTSTAANHRQNAEKGIE